MSDSIALEDHVRRVVHLYKAGQLPLVLRGREFGLRDLRVVLRCTSDFYGFGRTRISREICTELDWRQPNGWLKDRACRDVLLRLENLGILRLPPRLTQGATGVVNADGEGSLSRYNFRTPVSTMPTALELTLAKGGRLEREWNAIVGQFHYLGYKTMVGRCLKYLVVGDGRLLAAACFSSCAWQVTARDQALREAGMAEDLVRQKTINNSRFVILPHISVEHLASRILAQATQQVALDWERYYAIRPVIAETFVDPDLYDGTCYLAANWVDVGETKGYAKIGNSHQNSRRPKKVLLYGLTRSVRNTLAEIRSGES